MHLVRHFADAWCSVIYKFSSCSYQNFIDAGEKEIMAAEIQGLRDQVPAKVQLI